MKIEVLHGQRVYVDTNALIYAFEGEPERQPSGVAAFWRAISAGQVLAFASLLVRAEVLVLPLRNSDAARVAFYQRLFDTPAHLHDATLNSAVADASATLRAHHPSLKLIDALHLAAAQESTCKYFLSADQGLRTPARGSVTMLAYQDLD